MSIIEYVDSNTLWQVKRYPGNTYKSFRSLAEAQEWIKTPGTRTPTPSPPIGVGSSAGLLASFLLPNPNKAPVLPVSEPSVPSKPPSIQAEKPQVTAESGVSLSLEQTLVLNTVKSGGNVFFTGSAGRFHGNTGCTQYLMSQGRASPYC